MKQAKKVQMHERMVEGNGIHDVDPSGLPCLGSIDLDELAHETNVKFALEGPYLQIFDDAVRDPERHAFVTSRINDLCKVLGYTQTWQVDLVKAALVKATVKIDLIDGIRFV